jgi:ketosteroid isomerase-like protein
MLRRVSAAALAFSLLTASAQERLYTATPEQLQVVKVVLAEQTAWNKGDLDGYLSHFKDSQETQAVLGTLVRGMPAIRSAFKANYPNRESMGQLEYMEVEARELGEKFAMATGRYRLERSKKSGGGAEGTFTEIFEKTDSGWIVIFSETT